MISPNGESEDRRDADKVWTARDTIEVTGEVSDWNDNFTPTTNLQQQNIIRLLNVTPAVPSIPSE
jgi:hypothetical protein